jgi:uncharacterized protein with GYD domain
MARNNFRKKEFHMAKFLMQVSFTRDGIKGLTKEGGTKRREAVQQFFGGVGGKLETLSFAFGEIDVFAVAEFPDNVSAAAVSLAANSAGVVHVKATPLITPEEMDQAARKVEGLRAPGA